MVTDLINAPTNVGGYKLNEGARVVRGQKNVKRRDEDEDEDDADGD